MINNIQIRNSILQLQGYFLSHKTRRKKWIVGHLFFVPPLHGSNPKILLPNDQQLQQHIKTIFHDKTFNHQLIDNIATSITKTTINELINEEKYTLKLIHIILSLSPKSFNDEINKIEQAIFLK